MYYIVIFCIVTLIKLGFSVCFYFKRFNEWIRSKFFGVEYLKIKNSKLFRLESG